jgi:hypothetical protein
MKVRTAIAIAGALLLPVTLLAQSVTRDWDKKYDFATVKTFAMKIGTSWGNQLSERKVMADMAEALVEKGWKQIEAESTANVVVVIHGATQVKHTLNTFYSGGMGGYGYGYYGMGGGGMGTSTTTSSEYTVGTLVVDIFDIKTKNLVYRGTASDEINKDPKKNEKKIDKAAQKLFKDFPQKDKK